MKFALRVTSGRITGKAKRNLRNKHMIQLMYGRPEGQWAGTAQSL